MGLATRLPLNRLWLILCFHQLHRIMQLDEGADRVQVSTTDMPQRIGEALKRAYDGELELHYGDDEYTVHVHWR